MITKFRFFTIVDYEREEEFLRKMANKGYQLEEIVGVFFYKFSESEPRDTIYRLDYGIHKENEKKEYIQLFEDYGWDYMFDFVDWSYFKTDQDNPNTEIFSDNESRLELANRIFKHRYIPILIIFLLTVVPIFYRVLIFGERFESLKVIAPIWGFLFAVYLIVIGYTGYGLYKINKKYKR